MQGPLPLSKEAWREYDFKGRIYRIDSPLKIWLGETTHRILDSCGIVHCAPRPGYDGCVLRWMPEDAHEPVNW